ncbi:MAG: HAD hydrolase family protein [Polyangiaceae bacterium]
MKPLAALGADEARALVGLAFDLDDTVLDGGALGEAAYGAMFRMREAGLELVACTGRPAGWGEVVQRQWPVAATVTENGAVAFSREGGRVRRLDALAPGERRLRRARLLELASELGARHGAALADDNAARSSDVTLDIGEHATVAPAAIAAMVAEARARGVRTTVSSVHLHLTLDGDDKASGLLRVLGELRGEDATRARRRWAFAGDSGNDAAASRLRHHLRGGQRRPAPRSPHRAAALAGAAARRRGLRGDRRASGGVASSHAARTSVNGASTTPPGPP